MHKRFVFAATNRYRLQSILALQGHLISVTLVLIKDGKQCFVCSCYMQNVKLYDLSSLLDNILDGSCFWKNGHDLLAAIDTAPLYGYVANPVEAQWHLHLFLFQKCQKLRYLLYDWLNTWSGLNRPLTILIVFKGTLTIMVRLLLKISRLFLHS